MWVLSHNGGHFERRIHCLQHIDILEDGEVRQGLKAFSEWPTYPQLYVDGNLIGGLDIVREMREDGDGSLRDQLEL